jgi:hypothetical protein
VPGAGPADNLQFLWNIWWMREVLSDPDLTFFRTSYQFHPAGVDLVLHTHTALASLAGATVFGRLPLPVALNLTVIGGAALNGFAAYLLAYRASGHRLAAVTAGVFFAACPPMASHLYGHFNLYAAWVLVLFAHVLLEAFARGSRLWAAGAGALLAAVAWNDYYYFVCACVFLGCVLVHRVFAPGVRCAPGWTAHGRADRVLLGLAAAGFAVSLSVWWTGGGAMDVAGVRVSLTTGTNVRALSTALLLAWLWRRRRPAPTTELARARLVPDLRLGAIVLGVGALLMWPIAAAALDLWRGGHYVSQTYLWRSAPAGADLGSLVLGNPFNGLWGPQVMRLYGELGMNAFAGPLWLGVAPLALLLTRRSWQGHPAARLWLLIAGVFLVWTLGPYLDVFGIDTGLPLPQMLLRFVPIVSNARIPGHASVFVALGVAVLLALAVASSPRRWPAAAIGALLAVLLADFCTAPFPMHRLEMPAIYGRLTERPAGAVLELPLGFRDGFGEEGRFDPNVLYYQSLHGRPIAGGYISRLSPIVKAGYQESPAFSTLLRLSSGGNADGSPAPTPEAARAELARAGIQYIVVNTATASPALREYVVAMGVEEIDADGVRRVYGVDP